MLLPTDLRALREEQKIRQLRSFSQGVCRVDVVRLVQLDAAKLAEASQVIEACDECASGGHTRRPGAPKPFCMKCGRDLAPIEAH